MVSQSRPRYVSQRTFTRTAMQFLLFGGTIKAEQETGAKVNDVNIN
jgi:hypothetical protein